MTSWMHFWKRELIRTNDANNTFFAPGRTDKDPDCQSVIGYHLVIQHSHGKSPFFIGKPSINGPFSMAMLNNQRVFSKMC